LVGWNLTGCHPGAIGGIPAVRGLGLPGLHQPRVAKTPDGGPGTTTSPGQFWKECAVYVGDPMVNHDSWLSGLLEDRGRTAAGQTRVNRGQGGADRAGRVTGAASPAVDRAGGSGSLPREALGRGRGPCPAGGAWRRVIACTGGQPPRARARRAPGRPQPGSQRPASRQGNGGNRSREGWHSDREEAGSWGFCGSAHRLPSKPFPGWSRPRPVAGIPRLGH